MAELRCVCDEIDPSDRPCLVCECASTDRSALTTELLEEIIATPNVVMLVNEDVLAEIARLARDAMKLRAENARLREAMPTDEENDALLDLRVATMHLTDSTVLGRWIHRLDAAKEGR